jgi:poly(3-hydroxyalkanoate) depolymerase
MIAPPAEQGADVTEPMPGLAPIVEHRVTEVTVRGRRLRVAVRPASGPGLARTPLLLMNGLGARLEVLEPLVDQLPPDLEVIRFDVPGVGGSPAPLLPYHYATLASLVGALVRCLGHERVDVLGFSWGGGLAQQFAVTQARKCRRLVLTATGTGAVMVPGRPRVLGHMLTPRRYRDPDYAKNIASHLYGGTMRIHPERAAEVLHTHARSGSTRGYVYQLLAIAAWTSLHALPLIRQPTLVLSGDDDPLIPTINARIMARGIPRARLHLYRGGHLALVTEAAELAPVIDTFLAAR